ncbi:GlxA family transcriptional regulator [Roseibacterium sp. SDUM158017]|uniref:GlxA family transcriptional regulator n=1 Tax=Roseicyclus salinarum TaxID=3036773 RepID=UPI0024155617|nr:GlxA family transcriptional regulator [Roseibacterium sp. SDUM158017]MDG4647290.1 GlxA family transcriptional regulator [Roseibacterium sp. SDUM158017]
MRRRIGFLLLEDYALMSCAAAVEPLRAANLLAGRDLYEMCFLSEGGGPAVASVGGMFDTVALNAVAGTFDTVFVVAGGDPLGLHCPRATGFLRGLDRRGVALGGISGGAVVLAKAGLLSGRRFTVHWQHFDALRELSPDHLMERRLFVIDRDRFTCAGGAAPLDMMHALITAHHGIELARRVADWFIHTRIREAGDPQKAGTAERYGIHDPTLMAVVSLMESHLADPLSVGQLAILSGMSARHLQRRFEERAGVPIMRFYRAMRLDKARDLLGQTGLPVLEVALATGFANGPHFARAFRDRFGMAPTAVRARGHASPSGPA